MRDVTLYEDDNGLSCPWYEPEPVPAAGFPAVVGITVAEIEHMKRGAAKLITQNTTLLGERDEAREALDVVLIERNDAIRERDKARAERDNVSVEAHHWMREAARYREALEEGKLTAYMVAPKGFSDEKREAWDFAVYEAEQFIARALRELGGSDE